MLRVLVKCDPACPELVCSHYGYYDTSDSTLNFDADEDVFVVGPLPVEVAEARLRALMMQGYVDLTLYNCEIQKIME